MAPSRRCRCMSRGECRRIALMTATP
jgi:hypothetical protein